MSKKLTALLLTAIMLMAVLTGCGGKKEESSSSETKTETTEPAAARELRMSLPVPEGTDTYNQAVAAKEYIEEKTNGELTVTLYPANQLGDWTQVFDELMMGSIDMAISNVPETYDPILGINSLAYVTYDYDSARKVFSPDSFLNGVVADSLEKLGIKFFGFSVSGYDGIGTKNEIKNPLEIGADKGCLIRVPSLDAVKYPVEHLGFRTSSIPYTDTYSSIQTGVVDGWIGAPPYQHYLGFRDVENYYYAYNSLLEAFDVMMSKATWDTLTSEQQTIVTEALQMAAATSIDDAEKGDEEYMKMMEDEGMTIVRFTADELETFANSVRENVWPQFEAIYGSDFMNQLKDALK